MIKPMFEALKNFGKFEYILMFLIAATTLYVFSGNFRSLLLKDNFDAGILSAVVASLTLLFAVQQSLRDKKFAYNSALISRMEDSASFVVSELLKIFNDSQIYLHTLEGVNQCLRSGDIYYDANQSEERGILKHEGTRAAASIDIYFPDLALDWNNLLGKISRLATLNSLTLRNYYSSLENKLPNKFLKEIDLHVNEAKQLNVEIEQLSQDIRNKIVERLNSVKLSIRGSMK